MTLQERASFTPAILKEHLVIMVSLQPCTDRCKGNGYNNAYHGFLKNVKQCWNGTSRPSLFFFTTLGVNLTILDMFI